MQPREPSRATHRQITFVNCVLLTPVSASAHRARLSPDDYTQHSGDPVTGRLREARQARQWSQARLIHEIARRLTPNGPLVASTASLKVYVSEWENGRRRISPEYRAILRAIFGMTDAELFGDGDQGDAPDAVEREYAELARRIESAQAVDLSLVTVLADQSELLRRVDRKLGAASLVDQIESHLLTLNDALTHSVLPSARRPVAAVLSSTATLAGWQALDVGAVQRAWGHYAAARGAAIEADQPALLAHAMGEQAYVLVDMGRPELAVELVGEALTVARGRASSRVLAWLHSAEAEMRALLGDQRASRLALEQAAAALPAGDEMRDPDVPGVMLNAAHLLRWRGNALALLGDQAATDDLYEPLTRLDATFTRAEAGLRCDLAQAHLARAELADAREHLQHARQLANQTGSLRHRRRIERLSADL